MAQTALRLLDKDTMDKQKALDAALGQIERAFGKGSIMKLGSREAATETEVISTGSLGLDIGLGIGGLPRGRIVEIYGPESSGKTTLALHVIAEAQKGGAILFLTTLTRVWLPITCSFSLIEPMRRMSRRTEA